MKFRKGKYLPLLVMALVFILASPASASMLIVNGASAPASSSALHIVDGCSYITPQAFHQLFGADVEVLPSGSVSCTKNGTTLVVVPGLNRALLDGKDYALAKPAYKLNGQVYLPLRGVFNAFRAEVAWDQENHAIIITYPESKNNIPASEWLAQSDAAFSALKSYQASGNMSMAIKIEGVDDPSAPESINMNVLMNMYIQQQPVLTYYIRQEMDMSGLLAEIPGAEIPAESQIMVTEMLLKDGSMYMKMPGSEWMKMTIPGINLDELVKQYSSQDPAQILKMNKDFGIYCCFGSDKIIDGKEYAVIHVNMDMDKLFAQIQDVFSSMMAADPELSSDSIADIFKDSDLQMFMRMYIDKATMIPKAADMDCSMTMNIADPQNPAKFITMNMVMTGDVKYFNFDQPFELPDVSNAVDMADTFNTGQIPLE